MTRSATSRTRSAALRVETAEALPWLGGVAAAFVIFILAWAVMSHISAIAATTLGGSPVVGGGHHGHHGHGLIVGFGQFLGALLNIAVTLAFVVVMVGAGVLLVGAIR